MKSETDYTLIGVLGFLALVIIITVLIPMYLDNKHEEEMTKLKMQERSLQSNVVVSVSEVEKSK
jgi:hypothetical protein